jgi:hypothetical protein
LLISNTPNSYFIVETESTYLVCETPNVKAMLIPGDITFFVCRTTTTRLVEHYEWNHWNDSLKSLYDICIDVDEKQTVLEEYKETCCDYLVPLELPKTLK